MEVDPEALRNHRIVLAGALHSILFLLNGSILQVSCTVLIQSLRLCWPKPYTDMIIRYQKACAVLKYPQYKEDYNNTGIKEYLTYNFIPSMMH